MGYTFSPGWFQMFSNPMFLGVTAMLLIFMFMGKGKRGEEKQRQDMLKQMKKGDEVQTIGGIIGKIVDVRDDRIQVKVDETANTKVWFTRNAIHRVIEADDKVKA